MDSPTLPTGMNVAAKDDTSFFEYIQSALSFLDSTETRLLKIERALVGTTQELWEIVLREQQPSFDRDFNEHLALLNKHAALVAPKQRQAEGEVLRAACRRFIKQAPIILRTNDKPRGYQGDSEMMRMVYMDDWEGQTLFGRLLHKFSISLPACQAIRNRRGLIASQLRSMAEPRPAGDVIELLSVACGPAQEIADIFCTPSDIRRFSVTLLDQDPQALAEAKGNITAAERHCGVQASVRYVKESIALFLKPNPKRDQLGQFDFIYSMGLYDYLNDKLARKLTRSLFDALKPGGTLLLGNFGPTNPHAMYMEYWGDWPLMYRTQEQFASLLDPALTDNVTVQFEGSGTQLFLRATKPMTAVRASSEHQLQAKF